MNGLVGYFMKLETAEDGGRYVVPPPCFSRCREHKGYPRGKGLDEKNIGVARLWQLILQNVIPLPTCQFSRVW